MLDDLRNSATSSEDPQSPSPFRQEPAHRRREPFLGMTSGQRFVLALIIFLMICVLGAGCLVLTGSVYLPFL
jgi:hypothetical protein